MKFNRYIQKPISEDLERKMVFIGGPRQVGKTTLAKSFIERDEQYLTWDSLDDRALIKKHEVDPNLYIVVLDEIHKFARWRMLVKGLFDKFGDRLKILVTGSAQLDHFRKGGDSLFGRYHYYRLHPLSYPEIKQQRPEENIHDLLKFGGFPEPFKLKDDNFHRRWRRERVARVVSQDVSDLASIRDLSLLELLVDELPGKVGSLLSIKSLREDLDVSPNTVSSWLVLLEQVYYCFRIAPYGPKKIRAVKKRNKLFLWDWSEIEEAGARFENFVASHLLKYCHFIEDTQGHRMELRFLRDVDGKEVDFVVLKNKKPLFAVECKSGDKAFSKHLFYFAQRTEIPVFYQIHLGSKERVHGNCHMLPFEKFCEAVGLC